MRCDVIQPLLLEGRQLQCKVAGQRQPGGQMHTYRAEVEAPNIRVARSMRCCWLVLVAGWFLPLHDFSSGAGAMALDAGTGKKHDSETNCQPTVDGQPCSRLIRLHSTAPSRAKERSALTIPCSASRHPLTSLALRSKAQCWVPHSCRVCYQPPPSPG